MAERKRRGLGRGLGALISTEEEPTTVAGAVPEAVPAVEPEIQPEPIDVSRETIGRPERPIDVFFSAKSHLETQKVSRNQTPGTTTPRGRSGATAPRRAAGAKRAQMPDVLGASSGITSPPRREQIDTAHDDVTQHQFVESDSAQESPVESSAAGVDVSRETDQAVGFENEAQFRDLPVSSIRPNPRQPREVFDEDDMAELVHSVREIGVLQPIVVRPVGDEGFELIMGERRWRASQAAGRATVPAVVRHTNDDDLLRDALLENIHRSQLNPLEEAAAYQQLLQDFGISQEELSRRIGRSRPQISNTLRLMRLPAAVQRRVAAGVLSSGHARAVLSLEDESLMDELAQRIVAEGLSVRGAEEAAGVMKRRASEDQDVSRETSRLPSSTRVQQLDEYAGLLTDRLDTQVKISLGAKKGRISIDFASLEDLNRLMEMLGNRT